MVVEEGFPSHALSGSQLTLGIRSCIQDHLHLGERSSCTCCPSGTFRSECCFLVPQLFLFVAISTLLLLASVEVASWQLLCYVSNEIFWGPINSQPLQLASEDRETNELGEQPRLSNLAAVPQRGPTFRALMGFYSAAGFCILSSWTALGSWGLLLDSLKQELRRWVVCEREAALGVSVEGSECKLLARCFYPWLSRFAFQSC